MDIIGTRKNVAAIVGVLSVFFCHFRGGNAPSYVYRLLSELYHPDDQDL